MISLVASSLSLLYPPLDSLPGVAECDLHEFLQLYRRQAPWHMWLGVVLAALVFQLAPLFTVGVPLPAAALGADKADRHAHALATSNAYLIRQLVFLLKMVAGLAWGQHANVRQRMNMAPLQADPTDWRTE